jgi:peptidoglycan hydrolase-like protein with peptidoglycan-binding domain
MKLRQLKLKLHHLRAGALLLALSAAGGPALAQVGPGVPAGAPGRTLPGTAALTEAGALPFEQVIELQTLLAQLGFDPQGIDGIVGPLTRAAISAAQQALGLSVDGQPSLALLERLRQEPPAVVAPSAPLPPAA